MTHLRGLDGVRALACLLVFAHHTLSKLPESDSIFTKIVYEFGVHGKAGVSAFFVLSGFLLSLPYWQSLRMQSLRPSTQHYLLRRFARIVPGYYVCLLVTTVTCILYFSTAVDGQLFLRLVTALTFTNGFHPVTLFPADINGPLWSIGFEVISYMLMLIAMLGLFKVAAKKSYGWGIGFWIGVLFLSIIVHLLWCEIFPAPTSELGWDYGIVGYARTWVPYTNPFALFGHFAIGVIGGAFSVAIRSNISVSWKMDGLCVLLSGILAIGAALMFLLVDDAFSGLFNNLYLWPVIPLFIAVWLVLLPKTLFFSWFLELQVFRFIAKISFGIYIWHAFIIQVLGKDIFPDYQYHATKSVTQWAEITALVFVLSVAAATASWYWIEQPILKRASGKKTTQKTDLTAKLV